MKQDEQLYTLALTRIPGLGHATVCNLIKVAGSLGKQIHIKIQ